MKKLSFGVRLTVWYALIFALAELVFCVGSYLILRHNVYDVVDDGLEHRINDPRAFLEEQKNDSTVAELRQEVTAHFAITHSGDFLQLNLETGELIYRSAILESQASIFVPLDEIKRPIFRSRRADGRPVRFTFQRLTANGLVFIVEMGTRADAAVQALASYRLFLMIFTPLLFLIATVVGYWINRKALAPGDESQNEHIATESVVR